MTKHIVIDLYEGAEELDAIGPWEVLSYWAQMYPEDDWHVDLVSDDGRPRRCARGLVVAATAAKPEVGHPDVIVQPGGWGAQARLRDTHHIAWLREAAGAGALVSSVCTGALVLAASGLLHARPATTHHSKFEELLALDPTIAARPDRRWVDDGDVVTAAGVTAGIDMALHLVGRLAGSDRARRVGEDLAHPAPPEHVTAVSADRPDPPAAENSQG